MATTMAFSYRSAVLGLPKPVPKQVHPYLHYSSKTIAFPENVLAQSNNAFKPRGLWLSDGTAWADWCDSEGFSTCDMDSCKIYSAAIKEESLCVLDTLQKVMEFGTEFGVVIKSPFRYVNINWFKVAEKYDGIVIRNYERIRESILRNQWLMDQTNWFRTMDIDCACIWRKRAIVHWNQIR